MKMIRRACAMLLALILLVLPVQPALAAVQEAQETIAAGAALEGWVSDGDIWYYYVSGEAVTGWREIDGAWYYFADSGAMATGWQEIDGKWYYFRGSGKMMTGWQEISGKWYYFTASGKMATGWQEIGGKWYYFTDSGKMATGWQEIGGKWYYFADSGKMLTGWQEIGGKWYYFTDSGKMATGWQEIGGKWYYFTDSGKMATGWQEASGEWYYFETSGKMMTGWQEISGKWYYFGASGKMATEWQEISGKKYYFGTSGKMSTGWQQIGKKWYYFTGSGAMKTGWLQQGSYWYYLKSDGSMAVSEGVDGHTFDADGHWVTSVAPDAAVTRASVLALLDAYDPDGAYILRHTSERGGMMWFSGFRSIAGAYDNFATAVHEQSHEYTNYYTGEPIGNSYTKKYMPPNERIYIGDGKALQVKMTPVFDSFEIVDDVPEDLRGLRFDEYVNTDEDFLDSRQHGIYGLFNEYTAYCWGMNADFLLEPYGEANGLVFPGEISSQFVAFAEFRYYMLKYLLYAEEHYPKVYKEVLANKSFREAFTAVDAKFRGTVAAYRAKHRTYGSWETMYQSLTEEMNKKEYQELVELLKP